MRQQINLFTGETIDQNGQHRRNGKKKRSVDVLSELTEQVAKMISVVESQQVRIDRLESLVVELRDIIAAKKTIKDSYTTIEVAKILGKKAYTVREWCRLQRVNAFKAMCGRGSEEEWRVSHEELERIQNEGLLPIPERY